MDKATTALDEATTRLSQIISCSGGVVIGGIDTLVQGDYYVMANNPGGNPETEPMTIKTSLARTRAHKGYNDWIADNTVFARRIKAVMGALGAAPEKTFCTNAVFVRSQDQHKLKGAWDLWWDHCWPVHQIFLDIVRPRVVVCLGCGPQASAWAMLRLSQRHIDASYKDVAHWKDGGVEPVAEGKWSNRVDLRLASGEPYSCAVLGLPHPSNNRPGYWLKNEAGETVTLSAPALEKVALARAAAGR